MSGTGSPSGTITMYADQTATITLDYGVPTGGATPPPAATLTPDTAGLVTVFVGQVTPNGGIPPAFTQEVTLVGNGQPGSTILRAFEGGVDDSDIAVVLTARPLDTATFDLTSVSITDTAPPAQQTQPQTQTLAAGPTKVNG